MRFRDEISLFFTYTMNERLFSSRFGISTNTAPARAIGSKLYNNVMPVSKKYRLMKQSPIIAIKNILNLFGMLNILHKMATMANSATNKSECEYRATPSEKVRDTDIVRFGLPTAKNIKMIATSTNLAIENSKIYTGASPTPNSARAYRKQMLSFKVSLKQFFLRSITCSTIMKAYSEINPSAMK